MGSLEGQGDRSRGLCSGMKGPRDEGFSTEGPPALARGNARAAPLSSLDGVSLAQGSRGTAGVTARPLRVCPVRGSAPEMSPSRGPRRPMKKPHNEVTISAHPAAGNCPVPPPAPGLAPRPQGCSWTGGWRRPSSPAGEDAVAGVAGVAVLPVGHFTLVLWLLPTVAAGRLWVGVDQRDTGASRLLHLCGGVRITVWALPIPLFLCENLSFKVF